MSIIKGKTNIVAGFGGTKRCIGEVYFSQSSLASDNPGALPGWTGEYYENGKTLFPDLYNFVKAHSELQVTKAQYDSAIATYGECPKYVVDENGGTTTGKITVYGWLAKASTFYTKKRTPVTGDPVWSSTDTTQESDYTVISLSNDTLTFSGPTKEWTGTYTTTATGTGTVTTPGTSLRLPKYANYIKMAGTEGITQKGAGLPNISGKWTGIFIEGTALTPQGTGVFSSMQNSASVSAFGATGYVNNPNWNLAKNGGEGYTQLEFDASKSNAIYGASDTVQPAHTTLYPWISAYTSAVPASTAQAAEFTGALSGKANTDLSNVLSNIDYVVESQVNSDGSWYRKHKSGWLEQGGTLDTTTPVGWRSVTFLKPYSVVPSVFCGVYKGASGIQPTVDSLGPSEITTTTVTLYRDGNTSILFWHACGQGAN